MLNKWLRCINTDLGFVLVSLLGDRELSDWFSSSHCQGFDKDMAGFLFSLAVHWIMRRAVKTKGGETGG